MMLGDMILGDMILGELTAQDIAALTAIAVSFVAVVALSLVLAYLVRTVRALRSELDALHTRAETTLDELSDTVDAARVDLERVEDLVGSAEALASTVDGAARVGYLTVGKPVIKTVALAKGTSRAARRMRGNQAG